MVRITEELVRRRAEHNEGEIFSLEELSLHQQDIERIEYLDRWCKDLRILYFQNNLISRIENLSRLKVLEYLNLALNNITRIENLEGCESLRKLDLTVNFVVELTSVDNLRKNYNLRELYLTGNPCTDYKGYRDFVINTLPQLQWLDGVEITKSERIRSNQDSEELRNCIIKQQLDQEKKCKDKQESSGNDGRDENDNEILQVGQTISEQGFWNTMSPHTPDSRIAVHNHMKKMREAPSNRQDVQEFPPKRERMLRNKNGDILNMNEPKLEFQLDEDDANLKLTLKVFRYMSTSLLEVDVQPQHVRVTVKGKIFQLKLPDEVRSDASTVQRSQTTGHLVITMPKMVEVLKLQNRNIFCKMQSSQRVKGIPVPVQKTKEKLRTELEVSAKEKLIQRLSCIHESMETEVMMQTMEHSDFMDDPDIPLLI